MKKKYPKNTKNGLNIVYTGGGVYGYRGCIALSNRIYGFEDRIEIDVGFKGVLQRDRKFRKEVLDWCSENFERPAFIESRLQSGMYFLTTYIYFHSKNDFLKFGLKYL